MGNYEPPPPAKGKYRLLNRMVGPLPPGKYKVNVSQSTISVPGETSYSGDRDRYLEVTGPRFSLPLFDVHSVYPARNEQDATTGSYVPFVTLNRRTLPWDRSPFIGTQTYSNPIYNCNLGSKNRDYPWMALLVFTEDELSETAIFKGGDAIGLDTIFASSILADLDITDGTLKVDAIHIGGINLHKVLPTLDELLLLTHARQVNPMDKENCGDDADGWFSVSISNRVLIPDKTYHACLVSLEGQVDWLYGENGIANASEGALGQTSMDTKLVLLHHWTFKSSPEGGDFQSRMERLQVRLQSSLSSQKSEGDLIPINLLKTIPLDYLVNGSNQSGTILEIDSGIGVVQQGQIFSIDSIAGKYTVVSIDAADSGFSPTQGMTVTKVTIDPALASPPVDNAVLTFDDDDLVEPLLLGNESVPGMTENSYLLTEMIGSDGLTEDVLYRGPFTAHPENHSPKPTPYQDSDGGLALVQELGIWDISHSASFELGRLLALSDARFTKALKRWVGGEIRKQQQQRAKEQLNDRELTRDILAENLPNISLDFSTVTSPSTSLDDVVFDGGGPSAE